MSALSPNQSWRREEQLAQIAGQSFDVLVIGGGASGAGVFLDALSRGLSAAIIDKQDFTAGTSSRSTKLVHGGVRYLEQAVKELDLSKYTLVKEALAERRRMLEMAPHLAWKLNLVTPVKGWFGLPYMRIGLGVYDFLSGSQRIGESRIESKATLSSVCPDLDVKPLTGGVSYFDGQFDDARYGISMVRTGLEMGGAALNYCAVTDLIHSDTGVSGVSCVDRFTGKTFDVHAKAVVNCTGPWTDELRLKANPACKPMMTVSSGVHLVIERDLLPEGRGILIPETEDGRVLFMLPWLGSTLIGTTDDEARLTDNPKASDAEIDYILRTVNSWLTKPVQRTEVTAAWSGLRPLVSDPEAQSTASVTRDHVVLNDNGLISLTGGKWTTWRKMAEDCMDKVIEAHSLKAGPCNTLDLRLVGARGDRQQAMQAIRHLPESIREHLWQCYGDRAAQVLSFGSAEPLVEGAPYIEAELGYLFDQEGACTAEDILTRRWRVAMLNEQLADRLGEKVKVFLEGQTCNGSKIACRA
ncbi:glycerol-3-phosphate dehydrogenase/oxidase [Reinekea marinisedimentorum]|uniref:Glycerol-3-phosphate dehydrogenase n=1 Tax=Reinekea marinisedimentorum TaxID=230495 RepID=A0A4R3IBR5_9GAMM|nr:FAD-dependent oxidoreductase [Reinekea marinisedimentorum]TCS43921.1 glycerol-3-phosphate dehydrogenase [Reinekea marinisedimentorum]